MPAEDLQAKPADRISLRSKRFRASLSRKIFHFFYSDYSEIHTITRLETVRLRRLQYDRPTYPTCIAKQVFPPHCINIVTMLGSISNFIPRHLKSAPLGSNSLLDK